MRRPSVLISTSFGRREHTGVYEGTLLRTTEIQFVEHLRREALRHSRGLAAGLRRGIGDDCAVIAQSSKNDLLVTTDLFGTSPDYIPKHVRLCAHLADPMRAVVAEWMKQVKQGE